MLHWKTVKKKTKRGKIALSFLSKVSALTFVLPNASILYKENKPLFYCSGVVFSAIHRGLKEDQQEKANSQWFISRFKMGM